MIIEFDHFAVDMDSNKGATVDHSAQLDDDVGPGADESAWMLQDGTLDRATIKRHNAAMFGIERLVCLLIEGGCDASKPDFRSAVDEATDDVSTLDWETDRLTY